MTKRLLPMLLLSIACASDGLIEPRTLQGGRPGQPITVDVVRLEPEAELLSPARMFEIDVEVTNLFHAPLTVSSVSIYSRGKESRLSFDPVNHEVNEMIDPGGRARFELRTLGRSQRAMASGQRAMVNVRIVVGLTNGESYYYDYLVPYEEQ